MMQNAPQQQFLVPQVRKTPHVDVREALLEPLWIGDELVLARRVIVNGQEYIQGCWLDWPATRDSLLAETTDLLAAVHLEPAGDPADPDERRLAGLPLRLAGALPPGALPAGNTPLGYPLLVAWICVLLATAAVGALLLGTVALSERRAAFVSAVTHELRTPLTTFRLYTEMLSGGLVRDEAQRGKYLTTLQAEASRLSHLVENVLAYARLERRGRTRPVERCTVAQLLERTAERLGERAVQAGMHLCVEVDAVRDAAVRADCAAVEQILFNLVDNACKYAAKSDDRRIELRATCDARRVALQVSDHGPGISPVDARRLFRAFHKSASEAANSAPGVGLGLALSRRLARAMRGDLVLRPCAEGACFVLLLPRA
jgi:signal transduction histidine kinase